MFHQIVTCAVRIHLRQYHNIEQWLQQKKVLKFIYSDSGQGVPFFPF